MSQADNLCGLAGQLTLAQFDKATHALGWPDSDNLRRPGRIKWRNPYRNGWSGSALDPDWLGLARVGLAISRPDGAWSIWSVTELGRAVVEVRLRAALLARRLEAQ